MQNVDVFGCKINIAGRAGLGLEVCLMHSLLAHWRGMKALVYLALAGQKASSNHCTTHTADALCADSRDCVCMCVYSTLHNNLERLMVSYLLENGPLPGPKRGMISGHN